jgi:VWFA-related protein
MRPVLCRRTSVSLLATRASHCLSPGCLRGGEGIERTKCRDGTSVRAVLRTTCGVVAAVCVWASLALPRNVQEAPAQREAVLRVTSDLVNLYAVVRDKDQPVEGLEVGNFVLTEDQKPQKITHFSRDEDTPLTLGILIDTSSSQEQVLGVEQREAKNFLDQVVHLQHGDQAFVLRVDIEVELLQDLTSDRRLLARAIDSTVINNGSSGIIPGPFPNSGTGGTNLHDAVYLTALELLKNVPGRKVIVILSDGEDTGSVKTLRQALEAAQRSDVIIYSIAVVDRKFYDLTSRGFDGKSVLKRYAEQTGGRMIEVMRVEDTAMAFREIAEELRRQYSLAYAPSNTRRDGAFRKIQMTVRDHNYQVTVRRGYYAPTE